MAFNSKKNTGSKLLIIYFLSNAKTQRRRVFSLFIYFLCGFAPLCLFLMKEKTIYFPRIPTALFSDSLNKLLADALHTADRRVTVLLLDVMKLDERNVVVLADFTAGLVDLFPEFRIENGIDLSLWVFLLKINKKTG